jgi:DNA anti-recombination protein RmuC
MQEKELDGTMQSVLMTLKKQQQQIDQFMKQTTADMESLVLKMQDRDTLHTELELAITEGQTVSQDP